MPTSLKFIFLAASFFAAHPVGAVPNVVTFGSNSPECLGAKCLGAELKSREKTVKARPETSPAKSMRSDPIGLDFYGKAGFLSLKRAY